MSFEGRIRFHRWPKMEEMRKDGMISVTHHLKLLVWIETGFTSRSEVAENLQGILCAALIGVNPVFSCRRARHSGSVAMDAAVLPCPFWGKGG